MKITSDHLARGRPIDSRPACQTIMRAGGVNMVLPSARALGWTDVTVIDDDLGRSASGVSRPGFEKLLSAIC